MLTDQEKKALLHFTHSPNVFNDNRLKSLASSITGGRLTPTSREDSVKCLLLHAESLHSILSHKKVTAAVLLKYLHELNVPAPGDANKETLIHRILYSEWKFPITTLLPGNHISTTGHNTVDLCDQIGPTSIVNNGTNTSSMNSSSNSFSNICGMNQCGTLPPLHSSQQPTKHFNQFNLQSMQSSPTIPFANSRQASDLYYSGQNTQNNVQCNNNSLEVFNNPLKHSTSPYSEAVTAHHLLKEVSSLAFDEFLVNFAKMFYELLNSPAGAYFHGLNESHFFNECKMMIQIKGRSEDIEQTSESVIDVLKLLSDVRREHQLAFNPNLTPEGVRGKTDSHGLIYAVASGTLHHGRGRLVGVFEQSFILRKDPFEYNSCKIADSCLILRSNDSVNVFSQLLLPSSGRNSERNFAIQDTPSSGGQLRLTYS